jgi:DNA end-binding protein Ku
VLLLQSLLSDDEVRKAAFPALAEPRPVTAKELEISTALVDGFASDFSPEKFTDDYQRELQKLIDAKLAVDTAATFGEEPETAEGGGEVLDLMDALRRTVEKNSATAKAQH